MTVTVDRVKCACSDCVCVVGVDQGVKHEGRNLLQRRVRKPPRQRRWLPPRRLQMPRLTHVVTGGGKGRTEVKPSCLVAFGQERADHPDDGLGLFLVEAERSGDPAHAYVSAG